MDRKTLLAFVLIAIVLIFTPWYMDLVAPTRALSDLPVDSDKFVSDEILTSPKSDPLPVEKKQQNNVATKNIVVENSLYRVALSNKNGGSFSSFELLQYDKFDSTHVNLIDDLNRDNMALGFVSLDGDPVLLSDNWDSTNPRDFVRASTRQQTVVFQTSFNGNRIQKKYIFYPDSYNIDVEVAFNKPNDYISRNQYYLSWFGGLSPTEKNVKDDLTHFGGYAYLGDELLTSSGKNENEVVATQKGQTHWSAVTTKYFISAIIPETPGVGASVGAKQIDGRPIYNVKINQSASSSNRFTLYVGPLDYKTIRSFDNGLEKTMSLGWAIFRPLGRLVTWSLAKLYTLIPNYGLVVILFAFIVKILLNPLTKQSFVSNKKMQALQPEIQKLKEKYKNDPQRASRAQMELFKERGVNPMGGCLPLLLQMPILISFFTVFRSTIEFRGAPFIAWISDLSAPDTLLSIGGFPINVLPVFMGLTMFLQQKMMATPGAGGQQKFMLYFMNVFFLFLFYSFPSGLNLYYSVFNVLSIVQQKYFIPDVVPEKVSTNNKK
jgi:YidC/Oxa1 family membrane protein insertase